MTDPQKPCLYVVSACLAGYACRYDGASNTHPSIRLLVEQGQALPVCPELLGGLPVPRDPCEQKNGTVFSLKGEDVTAQFKSGAEAALALAKEYDCSSAILKARSPSCGCGSVYDGSFTHTLINGDGVFATLLRQNDFLLFTEETFVFPQ